MSDKTLPIETKLINSSSFRSLITERSVLDVVKSSAWEVFHGSFYKDSETGKLREIDVSGLQVWRKRGRDLATPLVKIRCFVECKSIPGYHIIVTPARNEQPRLIYSGMKHVSDDRNPKLIELLKLEHLTEVERYLILKGMNDIVCPNGIYPHKGLLFEPPPSELVVTAFRETNIGAEKDLDNSVLWKAGQALESVIRAHGLAFQEEILDDLHVDFNVAIEIGIDRVSSALQTFRRHARHFEIYHPVIVLESSIWKATDRAITPLNSFRFAKIDMHRAFAIDQWFDVVRLDYFPQYMEEITSYYMTKYKEHKFVRKWHHKAVAGSRKRRP